MPWGLRADVGPQPVRWKKGTPTFKKGHPLTYVEYRGTEAVVSIPDGELIEGEVLLKKLRILQDWIAIHEEELMAQLGQSAPARFCQAVDFPMR